MAKCNNPATVRYTWPGKDEARICMICGLKLSGVAQAIGLHLQIIPLTVDETIEDHQCTQNVKEEE